MGIVNGRRRRGNSFGVGGGWLKKIRTELSVEIDDVFVVRRLGRSVEGWCAGCGGAATLVTPEDAGVLTGTGTRSVYRLVETGAIHWGEAPGDLLLVCLGSLLEQTGQKLNPE